MQVLLKQRSVGATGGLCLRALPCRPKPQVAAAAGDQIGRPYKARFSCMTYFVLLLYAQ